MRRPALTRQWCTAPTASALGIGSSVWLAFRSERTTSSTPLSAACSALRQSLLSDCPRLSVAGNLHCSSAVLIIDWTRTPSSSDSLSTGEAKLSSVEADSALPQHDG